MSPPRETPVARLLVVDDQPLIRLAIKATLERDATLEVVSEAKDGLLALQRCREVRPDLILMDISMPRMDGLEATRKIKEEFPLTSVLVLTAHADHRLLMDAVNAGAAGYVVKGEDPRRIREAVRAVLDGETPLDPGLAMKLLRSLGEQAQAQEEADPARPPAQPAISKADASLARPLTRREAEILGYLTLGKPNRQIAEELHLSLSTVKRHVERILSKLEVSDRTQAAVKAIEMGLLPPLSREACRSR